MPSSASTRPTNHTIDIIITSKPEPIRFSNPYAAIAYIDDRALRHVDADLMIEYFLARPMVAAGVLRRSNQLAFIDEVVLICMHLHRRDIIHTSAYLQAGCKFTTMRDPRTLFIGAVLCSTMDESRVILRQLSDHLVETTRSLEMTQQIFAEAIGGQLRGADIVEAYNAVVHDAYEQLGSAPKTNGEYALLKRFPPILIPDSTSR